MISLQCKTRLLLFRRIEKGGDGLGPGRRGDFESRRGCMTSHACILSMPPAHVFPFFLNRPRLVAAERDRDLPAAKLYGDGNQRRTNTYRNLNIFNSCFGPNMRIIPQMILFPTTEKYNKQIKLIKLFINMR